MDPVGIIAVGALLYFVLQRRPPPVDDDPGVSGRGEGAGAQEGAQYSADQRLGNEVVPTGAYVDGQTIEVELGNPYAFFYGGSSAHAIHEPMGEGRNVTMAPGRQVSWGTSGPLSGTATFTNTEPFPDRTYPTYKAQGQRGVRFAGMISISDNPKWLPRALSLHGAYSSSGGRGAVPGFNGAVPDGPHAPGDDQNRHGSARRAEVKGIQTRWGPMALAEETVNFSAWTLATHDNPDQELRLFVGAKSWTAARIVVGADGAETAIHMPLTETVRRLAWVPPGSLGLSPSTDATARANIPATESPWAVAPYSGWAEMVRTRQGMVATDSGSWRGWLWRFGYLRLENDIRFNGWMRGTQARAHGYSPNYGWMASGVGVLPVARVDGTERVPQSLNGEYTLGPFGNGFNSYYWSRAEPGNYVGGWRDGAGATHAIGVSSTWPDVPFPLGAPVQRAALEAKGYRQHFPTEEP